MSNSSKGIFKKSISNALDAVYNTYSEYILNLRTKGLNLEKIKEVYKKKGYEFEDEINIGGILKSNAPLSDKFDDIIFITYRVKERNNEMDVNFYAATCNPGKYYTLNPMNPKGTANVLPGQYKNLWQVGTHKSPSRDIYPALVQTGNSIKVWRDRNKDGILNEGDLFLDEGFFGINCHPADISYKGEKYELVGKWSAGCQVIQRYQDWLEFINIVLSSEKYKKNPKAKFTYTLFLDKDFDLEL